MAREGLLYSLPFGGGAILALIFGVPVIAFVCLLAIIFLLFFFRDPYRVAPEQPDLVLSPADGKIVTIQRVHEPSLLQEEAIQISIFLSIFNVHINRSPYPGHVVTTSYNRGKFLPAFREKASLLNEQNSVLIEGPHLKILVKQIAGLIARRIVCWVKVGDYLQSGERFGLIKFGSRVDLFLPLHTELRVNIGEKVRGGETIIARIQHREGVWHEKRD
ncbi:MAG: phosphatidylserine decarboxylase family protein [Candidatus Tectomicrobia bacterium]|nr:phosphatidylserine decarboxylase family protein [Candidatus Tectomicrobia bacterium]